LADKVISPSEITLNSILYPITRPVQSTLASIYPSKVVFGDTNKDTNPTSSVLAFSDQRGGIGVEIMKSEAQVDRAWYSTANIRYNNHLILPPLSTATAASGASGVIHVSALIDYLDEVYGVFGTDVRKYDNTADSWGSQLHDLPASGSDAIVVRMGGTLYLVFAHRHGYTYFDGTTWTDDTEDMLYLSFWDDKLWGIDYTGQLRKSSSIGTWSDDAKLPLPDGSVTDLLLGRDAGGSVIIYAMTTHGLFAHDSTNSKFLETEVGLPKHPRNGLGSLKWRDSMYIPAGLAIYRYQTGSNRATVTLVGPDKEDGLPATRSGKIVMLTSSHNELMALIDATDAPDYNTSSITALDVFASRPGFRSTVVSPNTGRSLIASWDELGGWMVPWESADDTAPVTSAMISSAYGKYRLWWSHNEVVNFMDLPTNIINPQQVSNYKYASTATHEFPWFTAGQSEVTKVAVRVKIEVKGVSSTEKVSVSYATDYVETYTGFVAITTNGTTTYDFPYPCIPSGTEFRAIRFRVQLDRGSTNTLTPDMISLTLEYYKKLDAKWLHQVEVDLNNTYKGKTSKELRSNLLTAIEKGTLVHYAHRDATANSNANFYVRIQSATGLENTGYDERGISRIQLVEA